jgi:uncharacterized protein (DUF58 family)
MTTALKALQLKARHQVYTLLSGNNLSSLFGEGYDFAELREYQIGDDIRKINWMITAKLGKPYIKEFQANRELSVVVATFMDGSLYFGTGNTKQQKLTEVATLLGYATLQQNDLFTGISCTQEQTYSTSPTKQLYTIEQFSQQLYESSLLGTSVDIQDSITTLFKRIHKPSLLFVLSDFLEEVDLSLFAQKHEVIAIIIRDKEEESPQKLGEVMFSSPKNNRKMETYFGKRNIEKYLTKRKEHDENLLEHFSQHHIRYVKIFTQEETLPKLLTLFG